MPNNLGSYSRSICCIFIIIILILFNIETPSNKSHTIKTNSISFFNRLLKIDLRHTHLFQQLL